MFKDVSKNKLMLEGAYRKLKCYYYYNKNYIIMREKISTFESNKAIMNQVFSNISTFLAKPNSKNSKAYFNNLINQVDLISFPKNFDTIASTKDTIISNTLPRDKKLKTVNFFINMPIELYIIDCLWTLLLGKIIKTHNLLSYDSYGNMLADSILYNNDSELYEGIDFESNRMFNIYFYKYTAWRNRAFDALDTNYKSGKHSILLSLDIKSYFYSVRFSRDYFKEAFKECSELPKFKGITNIMLSILTQYRVRLSSYKADVNKFKVNQMPLPIGLFSSMLLGNLYLSRFDSEVNKTKNLIYYGRYVDDLLFVFSLDEYTDRSINETIKKTLMENNILEKKEGRYLVKNHLELQIQVEKIKMIHIDPKESRSLIDVYNKNIRIIPSQMGVLPDYNFEITDFDESAYSIENFTQERKIREIGNIGIDNFKVARYFSTLIYKQKNINSLDKKIEEEINIQIFKIENFFSGSQCIEYYMNWMNYMYFLVLSRRIKQLKNFYKKVRHNIMQINGNYIEKNTYTRKMSIGKITRDTLLKHLEICLCAALALDITYAINSKAYDLCHKIQESNMFNNDLISLPLTNFMEYERPASYTRMKVNEIGRFTGRIEDSVKIRWSPRFIRFEELLFLLFIYKHNYGRYMYSTADRFKLESWIEKFYIINHIKVKSFDIHPEEKPIENYKLHSYNINNANLPLKSNIRIAIGNVKFNEDACTSVIENYWSGMELNRKKVLNAIFKDCITHNVDILVLPELYIPVFWLNEVIEFSRRSQIAIFTGLQYIEGKEGRVFNYIASILPFKDFRYKNAFLLIREKNDYSPIEKEGLAKLHRYCEDSKIPQYQIYRWNGLDIGTLLCYEFTDIFARAIFKEKVDIIIAPVFNTDTSYFSCIIDSATRDLHTIIVQANTSIYGDSRITCPYDKESKDIVQIKGGENDSIIVGTIAVKQLLEFQADYYVNLQNKLDILSGKVKEQKDRRKNCSQCKNNCKVCKKKPQLKKLSARYDVTRARNKINRN